MFFVFVLLKDCLKLFCFGKRETFLTVYISVESVGVWRNVLWADESQLLMWQEFYKNGCALPVRVRHAGVTEGKNVNEPLTHCLLITAVCMSLSHL